MIVVVPPAIADRDPIRVRTMSYSCLCSFSLPVSNVSAT